MNSFSEPFSRIFVSLIRMFFVVSLIVGSIGVTSVVMSMTVATEAIAANVRSVVVRGNSRVDDETIRSYLTAKPGENFSSFDSDESLRQLYATGLFSDVRIAQQGGTLVVDVQENPTINLVQFEGNDKVTDEQLARIVQSQSLGIFSQDKLTSDVERVREAVRRSGRASSTATARVDQLDNNRVNVVFQVNEGGRTKISDINFVGNNAFGDSRLTEVISHNESGYLSWLRRDDIYDPDRLQADEERLRIFYFNRGYADFQVVSANAVLNEAENAYEITITVEEGERYTFGDIRIDNALSAVDSNMLQKTLLVRSGEVYSARKIERTLVEMTEEIALSGFAFAEVTPRGERNFDTRTVDLTFFVDEGPRTYIERIEVQGNTRTRGYVIRREFDISEGDAYNRVLVNRAKLRLDALGFFESVRISTRPGSSPDRVVIVVNVVDKSTGEFSLGGGYSSSDGFSADVSVTERNFLGRGQYLKIGGQFGEDNTAYKLSFTEPYFLGHRLAAGFDLSHDIEDPSDDRSYSSETTLARLRMAAPITDHLSAGIHYTFKREDVTVDRGGLTDAEYEDRFSAAVRDTVERSPYITSTLGYSLTYIDLDSRTNPREGVYARFTQDFAGVGGDAQYIKTNGKAIGYYLASEDADIVLMGAVGAGHIQPLGSDTLRLTDHFFLGKEAVRGFQSRGFGPRDSVTDESLGGLSYAHATAEVQFPIGLLPRSYGVRGAIFADVGTLFGNDFDSPTTQDSKSIRASAGVSLLWASPFGPLRMDYAHAFKKESYDKTESFHFGIISRF